MATRIQLRHDTTVNWTSANPVLALGEPGIDLTENKIKYGDGVTPWLSLPFHGESTGPLPSITATVEDQANLNLASLQSQVNTLTAQVNALTQILVDKGMVSWNV